MGLGSNFEIGLFVDCHLGSQLWRGNCSPAVVCGRSVHGMWDRGRGGGRSVHGMWDRGCRGGRSVHGMWDRGRGGWRSVHRHVGSWSRGQSLCTFHCKVDS